MEKYCRYKPLFSNFKELTHRFLIKLINITWVSQLSFSSCHEHFNNPQLHEVVGAKFTLLILKLKHPSDSEIKTTGIGFCYNIFGCTARQIFPSGNQEERKETKLRKKGKIEKACIETQLLRQH